MAKPTRCQENLMILSKLKQLVNKYPDLRFNQLLQDFGVTEPTRDLYYEESTVTLKKLSTYI